MKKLEYAAKGFIALTLTAWLAVFMAYQIHTSPAHADTPSLTTEELDPELVEDVPDNNWKGNPSYNLFYGETPEEDLDNYYYYEDLDDEDFSETHEGGCTNCALWAWEVAA